MCAMSPTYVCTDSCLRIYILIPIYMYVQSHIIVPVQETCDVVNSHTHYPVPVEESTDYDSVTSCGKYVHHL